MSRQPWVEGGCHCGAVRFRAQISEASPLECNCSICVMKAYIHLIVPEASFELLMGSAELTTYRFGTRTAAHTFCSRCGVAPFYRPRSHPRSVDVNARCVDGLDLSALNIALFHGEQWEENIHQIAGES